MAHFYSHIEFDYHADSVVELADNRVSASQAMPEGVLIEVLLAEWLHAGGREGGPHYLMSGVLLPGLLWAGSQARRLVCTRNAGNIRSVAASGVGHTVQMTALFGTAAGGLHNVQATDTRLGALQEQSSLWCGEEVYGRLAARGLQPCGAVRGLTEVRIERDGVSACGLGRHVHSEFGLPASGVLLECAFQVLKLCSAELGEPFRQVGYVDCLDLLEPKGTGQFCGEFNVSARRDGCGVWSFSVVDGAGRSLMFAKGVRLWDGDTPTSHLESALVGQAMYALDHIHGLRVDPDDDLVEQGLSSIDLVGLLNLYVELFGFAPEPGVWRTEPTLRNFSRLQAKLIRAGPACRQLGPCLESQNDEAGDSSLSHVEARLAYLERHANVSPAYNEAVMVELDGAFELFDLQARVLKLVQKHSGLRTTFPEVRGTPIRRVVAAKCCRRGDAVALGGKEISIDEVDALVLQFVRAPFDLNTGPLFRVGLITLQDGTQRLIVAAHHIICDGYTLTKVVLPELLGQPVSPQTMPCPMSTYAEVEAKRWDASRIESALCHWDSLLERTPRSLRLPGDLPRPSVQSHRGNCHGFELGRAARDAVPRLAREAKVTPFVALLGASALVLAKWSGQRRFLLAIPVSLRTDPALEGTVGCLVNTLPVVLDVSGKPTTNGYLKRLQKSLTETLLYPELPLDALVKRSGVCRDLGENPLMQVACGYREEPDDVNVSGVHSGTSKFDLTIYFRRVGHRVLCELEYATDLYCRTRMLRLASQLERAVVALSHAQPRQPVLELVFDGPRQLNGFEESGRGVVRQVDVDLRATGFVASTFSVMSAETSFGSPSDMSSAVARVLAWIEKNTCGENIVVGICFGRSPAWVSALLAVLRSGGCFVPVDVRVPDRRALRLMVDTSAQVLLCDSKHCGWADGFDGPVLDISQTGACRSLNDGKRLVEQRAPVVRDGAGRLLYGISTSGTTGQPKAACVRDSGVENLLHWYRHAIDLCAQDVVMVATSTAFDLTQKNVLAAATVGARLVLANEGPFDPAVLTNLIEYHGVTILNCTPTMFTSVLSAAASSYLELRSLRWVVLGGEPLRGEMLQGWLLAPNCHARVMNSYGPTECSDVVCGHVVNPEKDISGPVPMGAPVQNVSLQIIDAEGHPAMEGAVGELCIKGAALGAGYLGDVERTRRSFDERWGYKTGDMVRQRMDGALIYIGRKDGQIKLRGQRLHLSEVEAALIEHSLVSAAAVVPVNLSSGISLVGFIVSDPAVDIGEIRLFVGTRLPTYMVPVRFVTVSRLPVTRAGKIDRQILGRQASQVVQDSTYLINRTTVEQGRRDPVVEVMAKVLDLPRGTVGVDDDFFAMGGHSLLAVALGEKLQQEFGVEFSPADVVRHPTPRALRALVELRA